LANSKPTGVGKRGVLGAKPWQEVSPHKTLKKGEQSTPVNPATSGTQNAGKPSANGGGKTGGPGGEAPWRGVVGGVPPQIQKRERLAHISNPATSGTQNAGKPSANGGGQTGVQGGFAPLAGGVPPRNLKRGRVTSINKPATSGTQNSDKPLANGGGKTGGPGGASPLAGGCGGCPPTKPKEGASCLH